ncbi:unnamed protein product, partial [Amoebophrya sp. A25]|eukprot:GSA25T00015186001.1
MSFAPDLQQRASIKKRTSFSQKRELSAPNEDETAKAAAIRKAVQKHLSPEAAFHRATGAIDSQLDVQTMLKAASVYNSERKSTRASGTSEAGSSSSATTAGVARISSTEDDTASKNIHVKAQVQALEKRTSAEREKAQENRLSPKSSAKSTSKTSGIRAGTSSCTSPLRNQNKSADYTRTSAMLGGSRTRAGSKPSTMGDVLRKGPQQDGASSSAPTPTTTTTGAAAKNLTADAQKATTEGGGSEVPTSSFRPPSFGALTPPRRFWSAASTGSSPKEGKGTAADMLSTSGGGGVVSGDGPAGPSKLSEHTRKRQRAQDLAEEG